MFELLFQLLFWGGIVALVLWLVRRDKQRSYVDYDSKSYAQGYWDGYRAHQKETGVADTSEPPAHEVASQPLELAKETPAVTPEMKENRDMQNINLVLYVASFLLVAAAALFIGTSLPEGVKFIGTWLVTASFYGAGLALYDRMPQLRPAGVAFVGTGLALLPFTGLAMYSFVLPDAALSWLITSIIGVVAFVYATVRLQSQVVAYFAIAFMISLASASVATLGAGLLWYFVVLVAFGSLVTITASLKPTWLPAVFSSPIQQGSQWIVPLTLLASLLAAPVLTLFDYEIITAITALYYAAVAYSTPGQRTVAISVVRALASLFVLLVTYDLSDSWLAVGAMLSVIGVAQAVLSTGVMLNSKELDSANEAWLWAGFALQVLAPLFVSGVDWAMYASVQLMVLLATSIWLAMLLRRNALLFFAVYAGALLPFVFGIYYLRLLQDPQWVAMGYLVLGALAVGARASIGKRYPSLRPTLVAAYAIYLVEALAISASAVTEWAVVTWTLVAAATYALAVIEKEPWVLLVGNAVLLASFGWLFELIDMPHAWRGLSLAWLAFVAFYGAYWLLQNRQNLRVHGRFMLWSGLGVAGVLSLLNLDSVSLEGIVAASLTVIVVALALALEAENRRKFVYYDVAAVLATIGLQRIVNVAFPGLDGMVYSHWWAIVLIGLAYMYFRTRQPQPARQRLIIGLMVLSFFSGAAALGASASDDMPYRLIFLLEHAVLLVAGLTLSYKMLSIWGAVGVVLAVLWLLSGYTFLLLLFTAFGLIGGAIYALLKRSNQ